MPDPVSPTLALHLEALRLAGAGELEALAAKLAEAARLEAEAGWKQASQHTRHKLALLTSFQGDLSRLAAYYDETLRTVKGLKNWQGIGLCLRSTGELAWHAGRGAEARNAWQLGQKSLEKAGLADAAQLDEWSRQPPA